MSREPSRPDPMDLSAYLDGEVSAEEGRAIEDALQNDPELAAEFALLQETAQTIRALPTLRAPDRILESVRTEISPTPPSLSETLGKNFGSWAALFLVASFGIWFAVQEPSTRNPDLALYQAEKPAKSGSVNSTPPPESPRPKINKPSSPPWGDATSAAPITQSWDGNPPPTSSEPKSAQIIEKGTSDTARADGAVTLSEESAPEQLRGGKKGSPPPSPGDVAKAFRSGAEGEKNAAGTRSESSLIDRDGESTGAVQQRRAAGSSSPPPEQSRLSARSRGSSSPRGSASPERTRQRSAAPLPEALERLSKVTERIFESGQPSYTARVEANADLLQERMELGEPASAAPVVIRIAVPASVTTEQLADLALALQGDPSADRPDSPEERSAIAKSKKRGSRGRRPAENRLLRSWVRAQRPDWQESFPFAESTGGGMAWSGSVEGFELLAALETIKDWRVKLDGESPLSSPMSEGVRGGLFDELSSAGVRLEGDPQPLLRWISEQLAAQPPPAPAAEGSADSVEAPAATIRLEILFEPIETPAEGGTSEPR